MTLYQIRIDATLVEAISTGLRQSTNDVKELDEPDGAHTFVPQKLGTYYHKILLYTQPRGSFDRLTATTTITCSSM